MPAPPLPKRVDYALVGGGLQNGLVALGLLEHRPRASFALVERANRLGGNHLWSFHASDLDADMSRLVDPLVIRRFPGYRVAFPNLDRHLDSPYACIDSDRFHDVLSRRVADSSAGTLVMGASAEKVEAHRVQFAGGTVLEADVVIDARGPGAVPARFGGGGYQKFVGLELQLDRPWSGAEAYVMDARVPQTDGFRFFYVLPLTARRVLVEDTYFSDSPRLDAPALRAGIVAHAVRLGLRPQRVLREEKGVLPLPTRMGGPPRGSPYAAGFSGGWFHPTTGYSFPVAARVAALVAKTDPEVLPDAWTALAHRHRRQARYASWLNSLLFGCFAPQHRVNVLERFYRLPESTIRRFYALDMSQADRARILCGRPPRGMSLRVFRQRALLTDGVSA